MNAETAAAAEAYDRIPYPGYSFFETHPDQLAAVGTLFGLSAPEVSACRVLELGCGCGENLVSMALSLPGASFLGIDVSRAHIERATTLGKAAGIKNVEFRQEDILTFEPDDAVYDYIICHGVFSWVPAAVRTKILEIVSKHLAPNGLAYASYNTHPGWHDKLQVREMMVYHAGGQNGQPPRVRDAVSFLNFAAKANESANKPFHGLLKPILDGLNGKPEWYVAHEHLEGTNEPLWFHEFTSLLNEHSLQYVADARPYAMMPHGLRPEAVQSLASLSKDRLDFEQQLDIVYNRSFRRSVITHSGVAVDAVIKPASMQSLQLASAITSGASEAELKSGVPVRFENRRGPAFQTTSPILKTALDELARAWPGWKPFAEIRSDVFKRLGVAAAQQSEATNRLCSELFEAYCRKAVEIHKNQPCFASDPSEKPLASPLARMQAAQGPQITNLRQETIQLDPVAVMILPLLDGTRNVEDLTAQIAEMIRGGRITRGGDGPSQIPPEETESVASDLLRSTLQSYRLHALLFA